MGLADNDDDPGMVRVDSGRGLSFTLYQRFTTALVQVSSVASGEDRVVIDSFTIDPDKFDDGTAEEVFVSACDAWSNRVDAASLRELRVKAGVYPLIRTEWNGQRCRVSVVVPGIGAANGVVRIAEEAAERAARSRGMVEVDRTEAQRTGEGIAYGFVFEHFDQVNAAKGVTVKEVNPAEFRCVSLRHRGNEVPAAVRVTAPVPGKRELVSLTVCAECWADAVVDGLALDQFAGGDQEICVEM